MATEPNKPSILLRSVKRDPVVEQKEGQKTGIIFECMAEAACPHCKEKVPLADAKPLTSLLCPACGGKFLVPARVGGFLLYGHIGEGEMGSVYRATDETLRRDVAVKLVRGCHADNPESRERLLSEACAAGKLNHPRVAQVYALNFSNGHPYLVMELVTGQDFAQKLEREGRIDERVALRMALDVADGLSALNREGLVHGDIKPGNIVLDRDGNAKLVDFGLSGMTRHKGGALVGTPNYIAPELLRGAADTHRSDLYSLGATLYHLLSGRPPIEGEKTIDVLKARLLRRPLPLIAHARHVSMPTRKLVMQMLEPDPDKRQASSDVVAAEIRDALSELDLPPPAAPAAAAPARGFFAGLGLRQLPQTAAPYSRGPSAFTVVLCVLAVVSLLIAIRERSFSQTLTWLRGGAAGHATGTSARPADGSEPQPEPAVPVRDDFGQAATLALPVSVPQPQLVAASPAQDFIINDPSQIWQSTNLGQPTQRGSTMQMGGTLIIQGTGIDMWSGHDRCRFVWTKAASNYVFSAQVKAIADNNSLAITGLLVKGGDPSQGPGLLFGFLGSGQLFLQIREPNNMTVLVKRSERPFPVPKYLRLARVGHVFEAYFSADGLAWTPFGACELELPAKNTIGFSVSAQDTNTLATAKFANISLQAPGQLGAAKAGAAPAGPKKPAGAARKK